MINSNACFAYFNKIRGVPLRLPLELFVRGVVRRSATGQVRGGGDQGESGAEPAHNHCWRMPRIESGAHSSNGIVDERLR
jgi:hypothetical protein